MEFEPPQIPENFGSDRNVAVSPTTPRSPIPAKRSVATRLSQWSPRTKFLGKNYTMRNFRREAGGRWDPDDRPIQPALPGLQPVSPGPRSPFSTGAQHRGLRRHPGQRLPHRAGEPALHVLHRCGHRELRECPPLPHQRQPSAEGRGADRGAGELLPLRLPAARRATRPSPARWKSRPARGRRSIGSCASG